MNRQQTYGDDLELWGEMAQALCKAKMSAEYAQEFLDSYSKFLSIGDKLESAAMVSRFNVLYLRYWEKLIKKIRGI
jgi:hypothetical protein